MRSVKTALRTLLDSKLLTGCEVFLIGDYLREIKGCVNFCQLIFVGDGVEDRETLTN